VTRHEYQVRSSRVLHESFRFALVSDEVAMPGGEHATRLYLRHPGSVAVVAIDDDDRVALIEQYRHPARRRLWELPAGLRDVDGEDPVVTAGRELAEEVDLVAQRMEPLVDAFLSPGTSDERIKIYLATGLSQVPAHQLHQRTEEESELTVAWWPLQDAVSAALRGDIVNGPTVIGLMAAAQARQRTV
jgi:8-oxo-dGTP pyrophosphatase MutT (NUDIX family)